MPDNKIEQEPEKDLEKLLNVNTLAGVGSLAGALIGTIYAILTQDYDSGDKIDTVLKAISKGMWNGAFYGGGVGFLSAKALNYSVVPDTVKKIREKLKRYNPFE